MPRFMIEDTYKCRSIDAAQYIIAYANEHKYGINITKTLKLLYFAYGFFLVVEGGRLTDEHPVAWQYGPVFERVWKKFVRADLLAVTYDGIPEETKQVVQKVVEFVFLHYGKYNSNYLVALTHRPDSPWTKTYHECGGISGGVISDYEIYQYFRSLFK